MKKSKRVVYNKRRIFFSIIVLISMNVVVAKAIAKPSSCQYKKVYVNKGETLWSIANESSNNHKDVRIVIDDIMKKNNLSNCNIYEGQEIYIPQ